MLLKQWLIRRWYERDRPLFQKYIPLVRKVAEAGWKPVTGASCENENLFLERFGPDRQGNVYLTLFNSSSASQTGIVTFDPLTGTLPKTLLGPTPQQAGQNWRLSVGAEEVAVWQISGRE